MPGHTPRTAAAVLLALALTSAPALAGHDLEASFDYAPEDPRVGQEVTFTATTSGEDIQYAWDLDDDGDFDDGAGATATASFTTAGDHRVRLRVRSGDQSDTAERTIDVKADDDENDPPRASFTMSPEAPVAGDTVTFTSTATDPENRIASQRWDLDGDGAYDDARGATATRSFPDPGTYTVALRVVDDKGAWATAFITFTVPGAASPPADPGPAAPPPAAPARLSPFPVVRIAGVATRRGARLTVLSVRTAPGADVAVRCRGESCPWKLRAYKTGEAGTKRIRGLQRHLRAGTVIVIRVTTPGTIGKYTRFRILRMRAPRRTESCLMPGAVDPSPCPAG